MNIEKAVSILEKMLKCINTVDGCAKKECSECELCVTPEMMKEPLESAILSIKAWECFVRKIGEENINEWMEKRGHD